jgi:rRNA maturation endonuclease Nob1
MKLDSDLKIELWREYEIIEDNLRTYFMNAIQRIDNAQRVCIWENWKMRDGLKKKTGCGEVFNFYGVKEKCNYCPKCGGKIIIKQEEK